jgi:hypothetical protein
VVAINWNDWSSSIGTGGRHHVVRAQSGHWAESEILSGIIRSISHCTASFAGLRTPDLDGAQSCTDGVVNLL